MMNCLVKGKKAITQAEVNTYISELHFKQIRELIEFRTEQNIHMFTFDLLYGLTPK